MGPMQKISETGKSRWILLGLLAGILGAASGMSPARQDAMSMDDGMMMGGAEHARFSQDEIHYFESKVRPLLIGACSGCHSDNGSRIRAGFEVDTRVSMLRGGDSGPGIVPGDPDASLLIP